MLLVQFDALGFQENFGGSLKNARDGVEFEYIQIPCAHCSGPFYWYRRDKCSRRIAIPSVSPCRREKRASPYSSTPHGFDSALPKLWACGPHQFPCDALLEQESIGLDAKRDEREAYKREPVLLKQDALLCFSVCDRGYEERRG
jgi:hypothetical protein